MQKFLYFIISVALIAPQTLFAASATPSAQSTNAKSITHNSAIAYGSVSAGAADDNEYWIEWGVIGADDVAPFKTTHRLVSTRSGEKIVHESLRGLSPNTQYYFRVVAENQAGQVYGNTVYFTTKNLEEKSEEVVIATTRNVINVNEESATMYGYVAPHGGRASYWFEYGTDEKVETSSKTRSVSGNGAEVNVRLITLIPGTTYYYRVVAENSRGVVFGQIKSFKTKGTKPVNEPKSNQDVEVSKKKEDSRTLESDSENIFVNLFGTSKKTDKENTNEKDSVSKNDVTSSVANVNKDVKISIKTEGTGEIHQAIEYKITYKYGRSETGKNAELQISLPKQVAYVGDNTDNEMKVRTAKDGTKTYILPIGSIKKGDARTITVAGIAKSTISKKDSALAKLVFDSKAGKLTASSNVASVASSKGSSLNFPTTLITWFVVINLIVVAIIVMLKGKDAYVLAKQKVADDNAKKEQIKNEMKESLLNVESKESTKPHFNPEVLHISPNNNPIPVKPKIADEYKSVNISVAGLPGMEIIG